MPTPTESNRSDVNGAVERGAESTRSDLGDALEQVTRLNERVVETGRRVGSLYLDGYDKMVTAALGAGRKTSEQPLEVVRTLVEAQTDVASLLIVGRPRYRSRARSMRSGSSRWRSVRSLIATRSMWRGQARRIWSRSRRRARAAARAFAAG